MLVVVIVVIVAIGLIGYYHYNHIQRLTSNAIKEKEKLSLLCPELEKTHICVTFEVFCFGFQNYSNEVLGNINRQIIKW